MTTEQTEQTEQTQTKIAPEPQLVSDTHQTKPTIILPVGEMSANDIAELRANGFCVVESENPDNVRFMEPPLNGYGLQERAAIELFRNLCSTGINCMDSKDFALRYLQALHSISQIPSQIPRPTYVAAVTKSKAMAEKK